MPLVYEGFLGTHGINETGLQLQFHLPTPFELMLGVKVLEGNNEQMFGNDAINIPSTPQGPTIQKIDAKKAPSLYITYAKASFKIDDLDIFAGLSYADGVSSINHLADEEPSAFTGQSKLYGADLLVKYHLDSHSVITWQSELLSRNMDGNTYSYDALDNLLKNSTDTTQSGLYTQLVYEYNEHWNGGIRYENIYKNELETDLDKYSAMITYSPIESAFLRLQYSRNNAIYDEDLNQKKINTLILQLNITIGHHKSHKMHEEHEENH